MLVVIDQRRGRSQAAHISWELLYWEEDNDLIATLILDSRRCCGKEVCSTYCGRYVDCWADLKMRVSLHVGGVTPVAGYSFIPIPCLSWGS